MTELQKQVSLLRKSKAVVSSLNPLSAGRPSLFLTPSEAASIDVNTVYEAAISGLETLCQYDDRFERFRLKLLHPSSVDLQRELKTTEENKILDLEINALLSMLSLFGSQPSCHVVLEYLIRRYRINDMNVDALIKSMLVVHDSKIFAKIIQLCPLEGTNWEFLSGVKVNGVPLPKSVLVKQCFKSENLLDILCQIVQTAIKLTVAKQNTSIGQSIEMLYNGSFQILTLFCSVVSEMSVEKAFDDMKMRQIYNFIISGLVTELNGNTLNYGKFNILQQWKRASCRIIVQILKKTNIAKPLVKSLSNALAEAYAKELVNYDESQSTLGLKSMKNNDLVCVRMEIILCLIIMAQSQKLHINGAFLKNIFSDLKSDSVVNYDESVFISDLKTVNATYDTSTLLVIVVKEIMKKVLVSQVEEDGKEIKNDNSYLFDIIKSIITNNLLVEDSSKLIIEAIYNKIILNSTLDYSTELEGLVQFYSQFFPIQFDNCTEEVLKNAKECDISNETPDDSSRFSILNDYLAAVFNRFKYKIPNNDGLGIFIALNSALPQIRIQALITCSENKSLIANMDEGADLNGLMESFCRSMVDENYDVASAIWNCDLLEGIISRVDSNKIFIAIQSAINIWSNYFITVSRKRGTKVLNMIFKVIRNKNICGILCNTLGNENVDWILFILIKFVFGTLSLKYNEINSKGSNAKNNDIRIESLEINAYKCLISFGELVNCNNQFCKDLPALDDKSSSEETFAATITRNNKLTTNESSINKLLEIIVQTYKQVVDTNDVTIALSVLKLIISLNFRQFKNKEVPQYIGEFVSYSTSLLLLCINKLSNYDCGYYYRDQLFEYLVEFSKSVHEISETSAIVPLIVLDLVVNNSFACTRARIVVETMNSINSNHELIENIVNILFPVGSNEFLFSMIFNRDYEDSFSTYSIMSPSSRANLRIRTTLLTKVSAMKILSSRVQAISETKNNKNKEDRNFSFLAYLVSTIIIACSNEAEELREEGIRLSEVLNASDSKQFQITKSSKSDKNTEISVQEIMKVCEIISDHRIAILKDQNMLPLLLKDGLFELNSGKRKDDVGKDPIFKHFVWILSSFGCRYPMLSISVLKIISSVRIDYSWVGLQTILNDLIAIKDFSSVYELVLDEIFNCMSTIADSSNHNLLLEMVQWFCCIFDNKDMDLSCNKVFLELIKQKFVYLVNTNVFDKSVDDTKVLLLESIVNECSNNPGRSDIIEAIHRLSSSLPFLCFANLLYRGVKKIGNLCSHMIQTSDEIPITVFKDGMDLEENEEDMLENASFISGMSNQLHVFCNLLEAINSVVIKRSSSNDNREISAAMNMVIDLYFSINHRSLKFVLNVEYHKAVFIAFIQTCFDRLGSQFILGSSTDVVVASNTGNKIRNSKKNRKEDVILLTVTIDDEDCEIYCMKRVESDIEKMINSLTNIQISQVQISALRVIENLLTLSPNAIPKTIQQIGGLLSSLTMTSNQYNREELVENILRIFVTFLNRKNDSILEKLLPQDILQPLCENFQALPSMRRSKLIKIILQEMNDKTSQASVVSIMLIHSYVSNETQDKVVDTMISNSDGSALLILSKAAHRKAHKESISSTSEEFFKQSIDIILSATSALDNIAVCIEIFKVSQLLLEESVIIEPGVNHDINKNVKVDVKKLQIYCEHLMRSKKSEEYFADNMNRRGIAVTLTILHLEFILELLESKTFHRHIANLHDSQIIQNYFLELADSVLRLLAFSSEVENGFQSNLRVQSLLVKFEDKEFRTTPQYIGKNISAWCYETLDVIQRLVDIPSFITILQELINHDLPSVRQKAILILGDRLESLTSIRSVIVSETALFLDLNTNLRKIIRDNLDIQSGRITIDNVVSAGLVQTSLMCQDVLAKHLGSSDEWMEELNQTLAENIDFSKTIISSIKHVKDNDLLCEHFKILGSTYLCAGTIVTVLGPRALSLLATLMANLFASMDEVSKSNDGDQDSNAMALLRTKSLLIRTSLSTFTSIAAYLSSFFHPYIERTLVLALTLQSKDDLPDSISIHQDIDKLLTVIASKIPPRLSMPAFLKSTPNLLSLNNNQCIIRYADLLSEVWLNLDRSTVISQLQELTTVASMILDYRRLYGDQSFICSSVDKAISEAIVELCLKLTEIELRNFLLRLCEWRDALDNNRRDSKNEDKQVEKWRIYSRSVTFYTLIESLNERLKSIFVPSMSIVWTNSVEKLNLFVTLGSSKNSLVNTVNHDAMESSKKKKKKRSAEVFIDDSSRDELIGELNELSSLSSHILNGVRDSCLNDKEGFIDESRYEVMMPPIASLVELRNAFLSDQLFAEFCTSYVNPCISALALAVGKDLLWKPLNHKLLMSTRSRVAVVRIAAIDAIHELFKAIGEEYLLLLPESLPFLSELMEDDSPDVVNHTIAAIRFIEELSGEKLDTYLQ